MKRLPFVFGAAAALIASAWVGGAVLAADDGTANPPAGSSSGKPLGTAPAVQKSLPSSAPSATTTRTTGATDQSKTVKTMNNKAKSNIEAEGK